MKKILLPVIVLFALTVLTSGCEDFTSGCGDFLTRVKEAFSTSKSADSANATKQQATHFVVVKKCNIRSEPNSNCKIIAIAGNGVTFEKIGQSGNWFQVKLASGGTGWVFKDLVKEVKKGKSRPGV
jgi:SH3-like domain-containing protein